MKDLVIHHRNPTQHKSAPLHSQNSSSTNHSSPQIYTQILYTILRHLHFSHNLIAVRYRIDLLMESTLRTTFLPYDSSFQ